MTEKLARAKGRYLGLAWSKIALILRRQDAKQPHFKNPLWLGAQERGTI